MKHSFKRLGLLVLALCLTAAFLCGCGEKPAEPEAPAEPVVSAEPEAPAEPEVSAEPESPAESDAPALWVGTVQGGFTTYPITAEGNLTPDQLIAELAALTGWNLDLSEPTTSGKGGMSVVFTKDCALVTGPPAEQKEEFLVLDNYSLANWVLDSIEATLQHYFVLAPGDPSVLDIYFSVEMEPIVVEDRTLPIDEPWDSESFFS